MFLPYSSLETYCIDKEDMDSTVLPNVENGLDTIIIIFDQEGLRLKRVLVLRSLYTDFEFM